MELGRSRFWDNFLAFRERDGLPPWYILAKEELDSISLFTSYSFSIEPDREDVRERISRERAPAPGVASGQDKALVDMEGSS